MLRSGEIIKEENDLKSRQNLVMETTRKSDGKQILFEPAPIRFEVPADSTLTLQSIKLKPTNAKPLFNGKDLTGWKVFPGEKYKSNYSVTKEGWLNVKNGPGDLQTTSTYDNFLLQLECFSNGKALNSGVFFRCLPDEYQNGYEAQIHNGFKDNDRSKPSDFGTGAIYRRIPARKVVSNDHEWFTMDSARLRQSHLDLGEWLPNGRLDRRTARPTIIRVKGRRPAAGHLSIQGHDPTTDLNFRNIRLAELEERQKMRCVHGVH